MKTAELTGAALDWAVAKCTYPNGPVLLSANGYVSIGHDERYAFAPSTDWAQGGPIIEREGIRMERWLNANAWSAQRSEAVQYGGFRGYHRRSGPTPLIAAMRCYVASKLGDEIDVPKELQ